MPRISFFWLRSFAFSAAVLTIFLGNALASGPPKVLHAFSGSDGQNPTGNLIHGFRNPARGRNK